MVFTLPAPIADIAYHNKAEVYGLLFDVAGEVLLTIAADARHLGARIGATLVLHTWGSALTHHPHVHAVVPGGGLAPDGKSWVACRPGLFLSVRVLSRLFRRRFLAELQRRHQAGRLQFFGEHAALAAQPLVHLWGREVVGSIEAVQAQTPPVDLTLRPGFAAPEGEMLPTGSLRLADPGQVSALPGYEAGGWWVQDAAAALAVPLLGDLRGLRVLDLCAAPGGRQIMEQPEFKRNIPTFREAMITDEHEFEVEKKKLIEAIQNFQVKGPEGITKAPHPFFGPLTIEEWDVLQTKHLDHHLRQFWV